jgi:hypothetical protein
MRGGALRARKAARHGHLGRGPRWPSVASHAAPGEQARAGAKGTAGWPRRGAEPRARRAAPWPRAWPRAPRLHTWPRAVPGAPWPRAWARAAPAPRATRHSGAREGERGAPRPSHMPGAKSGHRAERKAMSCARWPSSRLRHAVSTPGRVHGGPRRGGEGGERDGGSPRGRGRCCQTASRGRSSSERHGRGGGERGELRGGREKTCVGVEEINRGSFGVGAYRWGPPGDDGAGATAHARTVRRMRGWRLRGAGAVGPRRAGLCASQPAQGGGRGRRVGPRGNAGPREGGGQAVRHAGPRGRGASGGPPEE